MVQKEFAKYDNKPMPPRLHTIVSAMVDEWKNAIKAHRAPQWTDFTDEYCTMLCNTAADMEPGTHPHLHSTNLSYYLETGPRLRQWWVEEFPATVDGADGAFIIFPMILNMASCNPTLFSDYGRTSNGCQGFYSFCSSTHVHAFPI